MSTTSMLITDTTNASFINDSHNESSTINAEQQDNTFMPHQYSLFFDFVVPGILLNIIGLLGLIGNTLSIIVLSRPQMRQSINLLLVGLASFDSILIVTSILMLGLPAVHDFLFRNSNESYTAPGLEIFQFYFFKVFPFITPTVYPIAMIVQTGSVYLTMAVTLERFVAVCLPFRSRSLCTYGRARYGVILIAFFSLVYNLPRFWEVKWETSYPYGANVTEISITQAIPTVIRMHPIYISVYYTWAYLIFMFFVPFSCLAIFNLLIYRQVRIANSERSRMSRQEQKEIGLATMLMVVVIVFFLCNVLALVVNILEVFKKEFFQLNSLNNLLVTFNSSVNFIIYCIFNDKFKRIFCKLFCCQVVLNKFGIYGNVGNGGFTETYVHRYPENGHRPPNTTMTSAAGTLQRNSNAVRGISPRQMANIRNANDAGGRNSLIHFNNNSNQTIREGENDAGMKQHNIGKEVKTLLLSDEGLSEDDEYCTLTNNTHDDTR